MNKIFSLIFTFLFPALVFSPLVSATHAVPGGSFNTTNIDFRGAILTNGTDQALTLWVRAWNTITVWGDLGAPYSTFFTLHAPNVTPYLPEFWILIQNFSARYPYPSLLYRDNVSRVLRNYSNVTGPLAYGSRSASSQGRWVVSNNSFIMPDRVEDCFEKRMAYIAYVPSSWINDLVIYSCGNNTYFELWENDLVLPRYVGRWVIQFNKRYQYAMAVDNVWYDVYDYDAHAFRRAEVRGGFISPTGSRLNYYRGLLPTRNVLIEYAYPSR